MAIGTDLQNARKVASLRPPLSLAMSAHKTRDRTPEIKAVRKLLLQRLLANTAPFPSLFTPLHLPFSPSSFTFLPSNPLPPSPSLSLFLPPPPSLSLPLPSLSLSLPLPLPPSLCLPLSLPLPPSPSLLTTLQRLGRPLPGAVGPRSA